MPRLCDTPVPETSIPGLQQGAGESFPAIHSTAVEHRVQDTGGLNACMSPG